MTPINERKKINAEKIAKVVEVSENDVIIEQSNGKTASIYNTELSEQQQNIVKAALKYDSKDTANIFINGYNSGVQLNSYKSASQVFSPLMKALRIILTFCRTKADIVKVSKKVFCRSFQICFKKL